MAARKSVPASKAPTQRPKLREEKVEIGNLALVAKSISSLKAKLDAAETALDRERKERAGEADTIASMLLRIVGLEKALAAAAEKGEKRRSYGPPVAAVDHEARRRLLEFERRVTEAEERAREANARAAEAESRTRAANDRLAAATRDVEKLRAALADADARARDAEDRVASRELESVRVQLEAAHFARDDLRDAMQRERDAHRTELDQQRERHARALKEAHDTYAEAFQQTLEDERQRHRQDVEDEHAKVRSANVKLAELTDELKTLAARHSAEVAELQRQIQTLTFDRDAADGQRHLSEMRLQTAEAKLQLVDKLRGKT